MASRSEPTDVDRARLRRAASGSPGQAAARGRMPEPTRMVIVSEPDLRSIVEDAVAAATGPLEADEVLTRAEAAALLKVHEKTVTTLTKQAGLPTHRLTNGEYRFYRAEVIAWLLARPGFLDS